MPAIIKGMELQNNKVSEVVKNKETPNFENTILAIEESDLVLDRAISIFYALAGAHTNDTIKQIQKELAPKLSNHQDEILLNTKLFEKVKVVYQNIANIKLDEESKHLVKEYYKNFVKAGANLSEDKKKELS